MRRVLLAIALIMSVLMATPAAVATGGSSQCDFNNDGYDDAAIGVSWETVGAASKAGAVNVIYGSVDKLTSLGDQFWTQDSPGLDDSAEVGDEFGRAIECGDFNSDGYADLVIASPQEAVGTKTLAGAVHLLFGSSEGLTATDSLFLHRDVPGVAGQANQGERFGTSLAAGDFNNDGRDDLAVGAAWADVDGFFRSGNVHVFYGSASGPSVSGDEIWDRGTPGIKGDPGESSEFGWSLATGDFDNNGYDDLAIGARRDLIKERNGAGSVNVIYGRSGGLHPGGDDLFHRATPGIRGAIDFNEFFGHALAGGDFDNNGYDDLAIGVPFDGFGTVDAAGSIHILQGGANGLRTGGDLLINRNTAGIRGVAEEEDLFGFSLTTGRFDAGNHADLAIGVPGDRVGSTEETGSVHVLYGSAAGITGAGDQVWHQDRTGIKGLNEVGDGFGRSVASGDFNGNGIDDVLIGVPGEDGIAFNAGKVAVIYGKAGGLRPAGDQAWSQESPGIKDAAEDEDRMGLSVNGIGG